VVQSKASQLIRQKQLGDANTPVVADGVPQADGRIKDYVLFFYTGDTPTPASALN
jgi:hypothetical protein